MKRLLSITASLITILALGTGTWLIVEASQPIDARCQPKQDAFCYSQVLEQKTETIENVTMPKIAVPVWLAPAETPPTTTVVNYTVATKGTITADLDEFKAEVAETLNSSRGWSRLGVRFERVESDGQFIVWLAEGSTVPSFSSGCDATVSCRVGDNVIINQIRWLNGSDAWNNAGGSLRGYRHMVINHETGHWLGHGHEFCSGSGDPAAVMQQQTLDMQGCKPNSWPLSHEIYAPSLGIYS